MRRLILLVVLAVLAYPAGAGTRVTVEQLDQKLTAALAARKPDAEIARQIANWDLSERLTGASLERLKARLAPGAQTAQALALLADRSAFLDPPVAELPGATAPDGAAQQRMLDAARNYVAQTLPRLPDFLATRTINRYDDSPQALKKGAWPVRAGLHLVGTSSREISVRNEREGQAVKQGSAASQEQSGLSSWGEFGFLPAVILTDTVKGKVTWSHWEQMAAGPAAVFHYAVPRSASHYEIIETVPHGPRVSFLGQHANTSTVRTAPAYHGSLWVDPATGVILRISIETDENGSDQFRRVAVMVQYAPVQIGDRTFICPARSLALDLGISDVNSSLGDAPTEWLNIASYSGYHRFVSTTRILADTPETRPGRPESASELPQVIFPEPNETASAIEKTTLHQSGLPPSSSLLESPTESTPTAPASAVPAPIVPASTVAPPTESTPAVSAARANEPQTTVITLQVNVNKVLVPVVVRDKPGRAVDGLKAEDFQVFDNDKPHPISALTVEKREVVKSRTESNAGSSGQQAIAPNETPQQPASPRFIVFLFDDLHLSNEDLTHVQNATAAMLDSALAPSDLAAVVSTSGITNSGFTRDHSKLRDAIMGLRTRALYRNDAAGMTSIGLEPNAGINKLPDRSTAITSDKVVAEQDRRVTLASIAEFVRRMSSLPGQRELILVSPGFAIPFDAPEARDAESRVMNLAAESNVTVSTLNARGVFVSGPSPTPAEENVLAELAYGTGGEFFHGSNDFDAGFEALTDAPEIVYLLELSTVGVKPDGNYHRLKVKVDLGGMQLEARRGYFMPLPEKAKH